MGAQAPQGERPAVLALDRRRAKEPEHRVVMEPAHLADRAALVEEDL